MKTPNYQLLELLLLGQALPELICLSIAIRFCQKAQVEDAALATTIEGQGVFGPAGAEGFEQGGF